MAATAACLFCYVTHADLLGANDALVPAMLRWRFCRTEIVEPPTGPFPLMLAVSGPPNSGEKIRAYSGCSW
ncbi:hypothetical protein HRbin30_02329 [bacterium HR30]|nr:hypothetical protein HRbin30_02329 [bacterium HR30]